MGFAYPALRQGATPGAAWEVSEASGRLARGLDEVLEHAFAPEAGQGETRALVAVQGGRLLLERYAKGMDAETPHASWSMAKSVLHAVYGLLTRDQRVKLDAPADVPSWRAPDDARRAITPEQLLRMRSGLAFRERYEEGEDSDVVSMLFGPGQADTAGYAAGLPLAAPPGTVFSYSSGTSNILSALAARALGVDAEGYGAFLERELFGPLGMRSAEPRFDEAGTWIASSFLWATARDFARFGLLYLRDGVWNGRRILPAGWVDHARRPTSLDPESDLGYGAHWWLMPGELGILRANGYNGQRILVVPPLDLVLVRLGATPAEQAPALDAFCMRLLEIIAAAA